MHTITAQNQTYKGSNFTVFSAAVPIPKVRRTWGNMRPVTRVKSSMKLYTRRPRTNRNNEICAF